MNSSMKFLPARPLTSAAAAFRATGSLFLLIAPLVFCSDLSAESALKNQGEAAKIHKKSKKRSQLPRNPTTLTLTPDNTYAYVSYEGSRTIHKVNPVTFEGYESIELQNVPSKYVLDAACSTLYVIYDDSNEITLVDLATGKTKYSFLLDPHPKSMAVSADGRTLHIMQEYCNYLLSIDAESGQLVKSPLEDDELFHSITHNIKDIQLSSDEQKAYITYDNSQETTCVTLAPLVVKPPKEPEYPFLRAIFEPLEQIIDFFTLKPSQTQKAETEEVLSTSTSSQTSESISIAQIQETFASEFHESDTVQDEITEEVVILEPEEIIICNLPVIEPPLEVVDDTPPDAVEPITAVPEETPVIIEPPAVLEITQNTPEIIPEPVQIPVVETKTEAPPVAKKPPVVKQAPLRTPKIAHIDAVSGPTTGGTIVKIVGSGFTKATAVKFGAKDAAQFTVHSATHITAVAPSGALGTVDITVTTAAATSIPTSTSQFTYEAHPQLLQVSPLTGSPKGGKTVTIRGYHFNEVTDVLFGDKSAASFKVVSPTMIKAVTPKGTDAVEVTVVTAAGPSATHSVKYTYEKKSKTKKAKKKK